MSITTLDEVYELIKEKATEEELQEIKELLENNLSKLAYKANNTISLSYVYCAGIAIQNRIYFQLPLSKPILGKIKNITISTLRVLYSTGTIYENTSNIPDLKLASYGINPIGILLIIDKNSNWIDGTGNRFSVTIEISAKIVIE